MHLSALAADGYVAKVDGKNGITLPHNPLLDGASLRGNVHADLDEVLAFLEFVRKHFMFTTCSFAVSSI